MSGFVKVRKARKEYLCISEWAHDPKIRKGEEYARYKLPPEAPGDQWIEYTLHAECAEVEA